MATDQEPEDYWRQTLDSVRWDIRKEGRAWQREEARGRIELRPEKVEMWEGKLFLSEEERLIMLGFLPLNACPKR